MIHPLETKDLLFHCIFSFLNDANVVRFLRVDSYRYRFISSYAFCSTQPLLSTIPLNIRHKRIFRNLFVNTLNFSPYSSLCKEFLSNFRGLRHIRLPNLFNEPLSFYSFPLTIESIEFGWLFNQTIETLHDHPHLTKLTFGAYFNQPLTCSVLPISLTSLKVGILFRQPLDSLPLSLESLNVYSSGTILPHNIGHTLPALRELYLNLSDGNNFVFPFTLRRLELGSGFSRVHDLTCCQGLETFVYFPLEASNSNSFSNTFFLPQVLKELVFGDNFNGPFHSLPKSLEKIEFGSKFNQEVCALTNCTKLYSVKFGHCFNQLVDKLPNQIRILSFGCHFNKSLNFLPFQLELLTLGYKFSRSLESVPSHVRVRRTAICSFHLEHNLQVIQKMEQMDVSYKKRKTRKI